MIYDVALEPFIFSLQESKLVLRHIEAEVGKVTLKSNGDEALNDEFLLKSNSDEELNDFFL
jgi:hypothetical protein